MTVAGNGAISFTCVVPGGGGTPSPEVCDGVDNDLDGTTDEGDPGGGGPGPSGGVIHCEGGSLVEVGGGGEGACPSPLPTYPNAITVCHPATGAIALVCNFPFANGDGSITNGCETNTNTNPAHCGGLNNAIHGPGYLNANWVCAAGVEQMSGCVSGFDDANGSRSTAASTRPTRLRELPRVAQRHR